jgi:hypothetical protein
MVKRRMRQRTVMGAAAVHTVSVSGDQRTR